MFMSAKSGNKYAIGNNGGRPRIYINVQQLKNKIDEYFRFIKGESRITKSRGTDIIVWDRNPEPATITGLVLFLGFSSRSSLDYYEKNEEFSYIIKKARTLVEHEYEKRLYCDKPTGAIFALKNMGWRDKQITAFDFDSMSEQQLDYIIEHLKKSAS